MIFTLITAILAVFCLVYYIILAIYVGVGGTFVWFWILATIGLFTLSSGNYLALHFHIYAKLHIAVKIASIAIMAVVIIVFITNFVLVLSGINKKTEKKVDYLIVLGAKVNGEVPSKTLRLRLDAAIEYASDYPEAVIIVSGGQGEGEDITEALAMKNYLLSQGINETRIILEDKSTTTKENLQFSYEIINNQSKEEATIAIVTSNFHVYRANRLAEKLAIENVSMISADSDKILVTSYLFRECLALIKEKLLGNI